MQSAAFFQDVLNNKSFLSCFKVKGAQVRATGTTLADRLKSRRKELGFSQNALANSCGVSQPTIANWERGGHVPRQAALASIANCLDVDPIWLLSGEMPADKNPAHRHLSKPIRNIPIFSWPTHVDELKTAQALDYVTMSVTGGEMLAITAPPGSDFPTGTILVFDKAAKRVSGRYLVQSGDYAKIIDLVFAANDADSVLESHKPVGRLILSLQPH